MQKMTFGKGRNLSRRKFIVGSAAAAGGGLALGFHVPFGLSEAQAQNGAAAEVNVWVAIKPDDTCVIRIARSEMGQGTLTGLAQLVAEALHEAVRHAFEFVDLRPLRRKLALRAELVERLVSGGFQLQHGGQGVGLMKEYLIPSRPSGDLRIDAFYLYRNALAAVSGNLNFFSETRNFSRSVWILIN